MMRSNKLYSIIWIFLQRLFQKNLSLFFQMKIKYSIIYRKKKKIHRTKSYFFRLIILEESIPRSRANYIVVHLRSYLSSRKPHICLDSWIMGAKTARSKFDENVTRFSNVIPLNSRGEEVSLIKFLVAGTRAEREDKLKRKTRVSLLVSMRRRGREKNVVNSSSFIRCRFYFDSCGTKRK